MYSVEITLLKNNIDQQHEGYSCIISTGNISYSTAWEQILYL